MRELLIFALVFALTTTANAALVPYSLTITSGIAHTSGGWGGGGMGDLPITGSFILNIEYDTHYATFQDINISLQPQSFDWNSLVGTIYGTDISLSAPIPNGFQQSYLQGTFDGTNAYLTGTIYEPLYDGYQYDCSITAVVPEPATFLLLGIGSLLMTRRYRPDSPSKK